MEFFWLLLFIVVLAMGDTNDKIYVEEGQTITIVNPDGKEFEYTATKDLELAEDMIEVSPIVDDN